MNHMSVVFKKEPIISVGSYLDIPYVEDYHLWIRMMLAGYRFANIDLCLVHARVGNGMVARRSNIKQIDSWKQINELMLSSHFITSLEFKRNIIAITLFVRTPIWLKRLLYRWALRKK